jgi:hypothetical protein
MTGVLNLSPHFKASIEAPPTFDADTEVASESHEGRIS